MTKTLQRLLEAWPCAYGGASGADADIGTWSQPTRPVVFVSRQFSCQLLCPFSGKYVRECLGKIEDLSVEFPTRSLCKGKGSPWKYFNGVACRCNYEIVLINMLHVHRFHELWKDMTFVITFWLLSDQDGEFFQISIFMEMNVLEECRCEAGGREERSRMGGEGEECLESSPLLITSSVKI